MDKTFLSSEFHGKLFSKYDIYSHAEKVIGTSITDFLNNNKEANGSSSGADLAHFLEASATPEMIARNLDNLREGLFKYFKGDTRFLPDIMLSSGTGPAASGSVPAVPFKAPDDALSITAASQALAGIEKINLGIVLQYINRNDITDILNSVRLLSFLASRLPILFFLVLAIIGLAGFVSGMRMAAMRRMLGWVFLSAAIPGIFAAASSAIYGAYFLPMHLYPLKYFLPLDSGVISLYVRECIYQASLVLAVSSSILAVSGITLLTCRISSAKNLTGKAQGTVPVSQRLRFQGLNTHFYAAIRKTSVNALLFVSLIAAFITAAGIQRDFSKGDFSQVISKLAKTGPVTQVISARQDTVYTLQINFIDKTSKDPVKGVKINLNGQSSGVSQSSFNLTGAANDSGSVKFSLDKGSYHLKILPDSVPADLQTPSPFFFNLKTAGTTIITVPLEEKAVEKDGIVEIEVLDSTDNPLEGLEMYVDNTINKSGGQTNQSGGPAGIFSRTNEEGTAVFRLGSGDYTINFKASTFPAAYILPHGISVESVSDSVNRYTIKLAEVKNTEAPVKDR